MVDMEGQLHPLIITGDVGSGKSTRLKAYIDSCASQDISCGGVISETIYLHNQRIGYDLISVASGKRRPSLRTERRMLPPGKAERATSAFWFSLDAFSWADALIKKEISAAHQVICIDEVGRYELQGKGFCDTVRLVTSTPDIVPVLVVRETYLEEVIRMFSLYTYTVLRTGEAARE